MEAVIENLHDRLRRTDPGGVLGVYLFGSFALGGLRPDSDLDVLVLTRHALSQAERRELTDFLSRDPGHHRP